MNDDQAKKRLTRRAFVGALAAGAASVVAATTPALGATRTRRRPRPQADAPTPAVATEIRTQKKGVGDIVKALRDYKLEPGSDVAFTFRAMRVPRRGAGR